MSMRLGNARYPADWVDLGAQSDLMGGAAEPMSAQAILATPNGGYTRFAPVGDGSRNVIVRIRSPSSLPNIRV